MRITGLGVHRVMAIYERCVDLALAEPDLCDVRQLAMHETSCARGHDYLTLSTDAERRAVILVTEGGGTDTIQALAQTLASLGLGKRGQFRSGSAACVAPGYTRTVAFSSDIGARGPLALRPGSRPVDRLGGMSSS